jgi:hypothetical protein
VSDEGDVLYVLPKDYRSNLSAKSLRLKLEPVLDKVKVRKIISFAVSVKPLWYAVVCKDSKSFFYGTV